MTRILMVQHGQQAPCIQRQNTFFERVSTPEDLATHLQSPVLAVVLNTDDAPEDWNVEVDTILSEAGVPVVWLGDHYAREELLEVFRRPYVRHLLPRNEDLRRHLAQVFRAMAQGCAIPSSSFLVEGTPWQERAVTHSREKDAHLEAFWDFMSEARVHRRIARAAQLVADEFLVNAVYNAPVDESGEAMFRSWARTREVELPESGRVSLRYACDGEHLVLEVRDPYGSLKEEILHTNLRRALEAKDDQIDQKEGGAGLGMYYIVSSATHMLVRVSPGVETVFTGVFAMKGGYRSFARAPRTFHFFPT